MEIFLEGKCNNDCVFCRVNKQRTTSKEEIVRKINSAKPNDEKVIFTGAEPTVREDVFELLNLAKKKFKIIEIQSNGRKLADLGFAKNLLKAGANRFRISLYGYPANIHNGLTRRRKSFDETAAGIKNLLKLGQEKNLFISTVVNEINFKKTPGLVKFLFSIAFKKENLFPSIIVNKITYNKLSDVLEFFKRSRIKEVSLNFEQGSRGIKHLEGAKDLRLILEEKFSVGSIAVNKANYSKLPDLIGFFKNLEAILVTLDASNIEKEKLLAPLDKLASLASQLRYDFLFDLLIKIKGLPYCLINEPEGVVIPQKKNQGFKPKSCRVCKYFKTCPGIPQNYLKGFDLKKLKPQRLPKEVMIEVEPNCNFNCKFCFNRSSFAAKSNFFKKKLSNEYVKKIIDNLAKAKIPIVRFTGGEPLLRKDIYDLIDYAYRQGLEVRLNTNGSLIKSYSQAKWLAKHLNYVLFSMHTYDPKEDEKITGFKNSFYLKTRAIKWLRKAGIKTIRVSTIATYDNIENLDKFYKILKKLKVDKWAVNRIIPTPGQKDNFSKKQLKMLVDRLYEIRKDIMKNKIPLKAHIVNAVPFCGYNPLKVNAVCSGARSVDGHERFVVDPRGFAKPIYYLDVNIGDPLKPLECWNHPYMKKLRSYEDLPKVCRSCILVDKCKGGNRYCAYVANKNRKNAPDPLMDFERYRKILIQD